MDWSALSRLVPEIAVVVVFIWFILEREKRQDERDKNRDQLWREFLKEEREQRNVFSTRIAEEIKTNTTTLAGMNALLVAHDTRASVAIAEIVPSLRRVESNLAQVDFPEEHG